MPLENSFIFNLKKYGQRFNSQMMITLATVLFSRFQGFLVPHPRRRFWRLRTSRPWSSPGLVQKHEALHRHRSNEFLRKGKFCRPVSSKRRIERSKSSIEGSPAEIIFLRKNKKIFKNSFIPAYHSCQCCKWFLMWVWRHKRTSLPIWTAPRASSNPRKKIWRWSWSCSWARRWELLCGQSLGRCNPEGKGTKFCTVRYCWSFKNDDEFRDRR